MSDLLRIGRLVDPGGGWQLRRDRRLADEPFLVLLVGGIEHDGAVGVQLLGVSVMHCGGGHQPDPGVAVDVVVPVDEHAAVTAGASMSSNRAGNSGRYFSVLKFDSE